MLPERGGIGIDRRDVSTSPSRDQSANHERNAAQIDSPAKFVCGFGERSADDDFESVAEVLDGTGVDLDFAVTSNGRQSAADRFHECAANEQLERI